MFHNFPNRCIPTLNSVYIKITELMYVNLVPGEFARTVKNFLWQVYYFLSIINALVIIGFFVGRLNLDKKQQKQLKSTHSINLDIIFNIAFMNIPMTVWKFLITNLLFLMKYGTVLFSFWNYNNSSCSCF